MIGGMAAFYIFPPIRKAMRNQTAESLFHDLALEPSYHLALD